MSRLRCATSLSPVVMAAIVILLSNLAFGASIAAAQGAASPAQGDKPRQQSAKPPAKNPPLPQVPAELQEAMALAMQGKPLAAIAVLDTIAKPDSMTLQTLATLRSFVGDCAGAHQAMDEAVPRRGKRKGPVVTDGLVPRRAVDAILEAARDARIVIINEAHHVPQTRAFILELLPRLRTEGFEYYAAETFEEDTHALARRGYPVNATGFYTHEPVFGQVVREALRLGFTPVAYEAQLLTPKADPIDGINAREEAQCRNLMERIFAKDPDARVVIHVGFSHAMEKPKPAGQGREIRWMASRLAEATGADPLTIDQTLHTERSKRSLATPEWRHALAEGWLTEPVVLRRPDGTYLVTGEFAGAVDLQVVHPPTRLIDRRPDWLTRGTGRVAAPVPEAIRTDSGRVLLEAYLAGESDDAIPLDRVILAPGEPRPVLVVPPGEYRVVERDEQGEEVARRAMVVEATAADPRPMRRASR